MAYHKQTGIYNGSACKRGHDGSRYVSGGGCVQCALDSSKRRASTADGREKKRLAYWKAGGKEDRQARNLKRHYGLTPDVYDQMRDAQGNVCAICGGPPGGSAKRFHVDHDHVSGKVRALLCYKCNIGLGSFDDDTARLLSAASYLEKHRER